MWLNTQSKQSQLFSWGHWFTTLNVFIGLVVSSVYLVADPHPNSIIGNSYLLLYWFGHISFIFFVCYILLIFPVLALSKNVGISRIWSAIVATTGLSLLFVDSIFYAAKGFHLDLLSTSNIHSDVDFLLNEIPTGFIAAFAVLYAAIFSIEIALSNKLWRDLVSIRAILRKYKVAHTMLGCFFVSHLAHIWADAKLYQPIVKRDNLLPLSYPLTAKNFLASSGLIDLSDYKDRKQLYFDLSRYHFNQQAIDLSCSEPEHSLAIIYINIDENRVNQFEQNLASIISTQNKAHYWSPVERELVAFELLYGLPSIYSQLATKQSPIQYALAQTQTGLSLNASAANISQQIGFDYELDYAETHLSVDYFDVKSSRALTYALTQIKANLGIPQLIFVKHSNGELGEVYSTDNKLTLPTLVSNYDLYPSLLNGWLRCQSDGELSQFGQNLYEQSAQRDWLVSADEQNIYVWDKFKATFINNQAKVSAIALSNSESIEPHTTNTLARAITKLKSRLD